MFVLLSLILLIVGLFTRESSVIYVSGLFAIAGSIGALASEMAKKDSKHDTK